MDMERRFAASAVVEGRQLVGLAAPFDSETRIADFRERIAPGAFARTLAEHRDILALVDHDPGRVLGRTRSGSLSLSETAAGLEYRIALPDTTIGRDLRALAERGIVVVAFNPGWVRTDMGGKDAELEPAQAVAVLLRVAGGLGPDDSGRFLDGEGRPLPW